MFKNLSVLTRLLILSGVMTLALLIIIMIGWWGLKEAAANIEQVYSGGIEEVSYLASLRNIYRTDISETIHKIRAGTISWREGEATVKDAIRQIDSIFAMYQKRVGEHKDYLSAQIQSQTTNLEQTIKNTKPHLERLNRILERQNKEDLIIFIDQNLYSGFVDLVSKNITQLIEQYVADSKEDYDQSLASIEFYRNLMFVVFALTLIISLIIALLITISITKPLKRAIDAIQKVAVGDLTTKLDNEYKSTNEMGLLHENMRQMVDADKRIVNALSLLTKGDLSVSIEPRSEQDILSLALVSMTKKLRQMIGSIQSDVISLTQASQEIVTSVSQVAIGSSETATAVTETTTTVEELKQTAQVSAEKAKDVLVRAEETLQTVKNSEKSLQSTIEDMNQINVRMHSISEGIIKLSELGQTIGEIIDTVNDLAEQSNLLAVNAAIEAAKAGEQGKGFGVVAQEIRTLAEQSKSATVQVRAILHDIQNATSAAVLATEQGSKAVEKGVNQSSQTSESMRLLLDSMGHVTQAANQIAISSEQQLIGVDQVNMAMNNINEATKQHIENMKTIENAVLAFNSIGQTLKQITDQYVLNDSQKKIMRLGDDEKGIY